MAKAAKKTSKNGILPPDTDTFSSAKDASLIESKHQQIVDAACRIFFKKGFHPTTIREIANASGMSMGQLYHYISSKDDVLYLVHKHMHKLWYEYLENSDIEHISDPLKRLSEAISRTLEFMEENRKLMEFVYTESKYLDKKHLRIVLDLDSSRVIGFWRRLLDDVKKEITIKGDTDILASLMSHILIFLPLRGWTVKDKPVKESMDLMTDFVLRGLGAI